MIWAVGTAAIATLYGYSITRPNDYCLVARDDNGETIDTPLSISRGVSTVKLSCFYCGHEQVQDHHGRCCGCGGVNRSINAGESK